MMRKLALALAAAAMVLSCGPRKKQASEPKNREFPQVVVPAMVEDETARINYAAEHFWDAFVKGDYPTDSLHIAGVKKDEVERQMGVFATILTSYIQQPEKAMGAFFERISSAGDAFGPMTELASRYFYDPNSPLRSEECWLPLATRLSQSPLVDETARGRYAWQARMCSLNRPGTVAADFQFTDISGRRRTMHSIKADMLLLIFGNPDCSACKELLETMNAYHEFADLEASGKLKVADIFIDREVDAWKAKAATYPKNWINGYDHNFKIREDLIYNVRAIPSLYLLDSSKRVILKDATVEKVLTFMRQMQK